MGPIHRPHAVSVQIHCSIVLVDGEVAGARRPWRERCRWTAAAAARPVVTPSCRASHCERPFASSPSRERIAAAERSTDSDVACRHADGTWVLIFEDDVDLDVRVIPVERTGGLATLVVKHLPPKAPKVWIPAKLDADICSCQRIGTEL
jgi:hypothetical protein